MLTHPIIASKVWEVKAISQVFLLLFVGVFAHSNTLFTFI